MFPLKGCKDYYLLVLVKVDGLTELCFGQGNRTG